MKTRCSHCIGSSPKRTISFSYLFRKQKHKHTKSEKTIFGSVVPVEQAFFLYRLMEDVKCAIYIAFILHFIAFYPTCIPYMYQWYLLYSVDRPYGKIHCMIFSR